MTRVSGLAVLGILVLTLGSGAAQQGKDVRFKGQKVTFMCNDNVCADCNSSCKMKPHASLGGHCSCTPEKHPMLTPDPSLHVALAKKDIEIKKAKEAGVAMPDMAFKYKGKPGEFMCNDNLCADCNSDCMMKPHAVLGGMCACTPEKNEKLSDHALNDAILASVPAPMMKETMEATKKMMEKWG